MKVLFVCTGNICRSVMAEYQLKEKVKESKKEIEIKSCGIQAYNGEPATHYTIMTLKQHGIDGKAHQATNVKSASVPNADLILCATKQHKKALQRMYPEKQSQIYTIKEYAYPSETDDLDIPDPWGYDLNTYENCYIQVEKCITEIAKRIK